MAGRTTGWQGKGGLYVQRRSAEREGSIREIESDYVES